MQNKKKKILGILIRLTVSLILIGYFIITLAHKHGGLSQAFTQFSQAFSSSSLFWLFPAFFLHLIGFSLVSFRWKVLLQAQGIHSSYWQLFSYYFMAAFFNNFLPSTIGGDTLRAIEGKRLTGSTTTSIMVVIVERLTGLMALVLIAAGGLWIKFLTTPDTPTTLWIFLALACAGFLFAIGAIHPAVAPRVLKPLHHILPKKFSQKLDQAHQAVAVYFHHPYNLLAALGVSLIFQLNMVLYYFLIAKALGQNPDAIEFLSKIPIMIFLLMTVPAINGLGVRTAGFKELMHFPGTSALAIEFIDLGFRIGYGLMGGVVFLFYRRKGSLEHSIDSNSP